MFAREKKKSNTYTEHKSYLTRAHCFRRPKSRNIIDRGIQNTIRHDQRAFVRNPRRTSFDCINGVSTRAKEEKPTAKKEKEKRYLSYLHIVLRTQLAIDSRPSLCRMNRVPYVLRVSSSHRRPTDDR